ncbi:hypothetical protein CMT41_06695 [Colwellia sp. MT41]|nr:HNH endonuclease signature motif containing protein [Colwellia sp. MT41]ALO34438.1 hypothetical protein CMT41_06695 [Colwellia sp. MT41]
MSGNKKLVRQNFRDSVFKRDRNKCVFCRQTDNLIVHHITERNLMPFGGYIKENGISLCPEHHKMAESYHHSNGEEYPQGFHPNELYRKIGSSFEIAQKASKRLERYS